MIGGYEAMSSRVRSVIFSFGGMNVGFGAIKNVLLQGRPSPKPIDTNVCVLFLLSFDHWHKDMNESYPHMALSGQRST